MKRNSMKPSDFRHIALAGWTSVILTPLLFFTLSLYLFTDAAKSFYTLHQEKNQPCQLIVTANELSDSDAADILKIESVIRTTPIYEVPVTLQVNQMETEITLYGISAHYLDSEPELGTLFPENSEMPYLFLNRAALEELMNAEESSEKNPLNPQTDSQNSRNSHIFSENSPADSRDSQKLTSYNWLNASVTVIPAENQKIISRICGAELSGGSASPRYYVSIRTAKDLLIKSGVSAIPTEILLRITNSGQESSVTADLQQLGYTVENADSEKLTDWNYRETIIFHTLFTAAVSLLAAIALIKEKFKLDHAAHGREYLHLQEMLYANLKKTRTDPSFIRISVRINRIRIITMICTGVLLNTILNIVIPVIFKLK